ncbi:UNVERIFIED_CONTAM: hypothetical protein HDU68_006359, partial [Siphonaria sp. JEL0065]
MATKKKKGKGKATPKTVKNELEEDPEEYEVETILTHKFNKSMCRWEYYVKWVGYDDEDDNTWEPYESFERDLIDEYIQNYPEINKKKRKLSSATSASSASSFEGPDPIPAKKKGKSPRVVAPTVAPSKSSSSTAKPRQESPKKTQTAKPSRKSLAASQSTSSRNVPESIRNQDSWEPYISRFKTISLVDPELK